MPYNIESNFQWIDGERITKRKEIEEMGFSMRQVMTTMVDLFSAQVFPYITLLTTDFQNRLGSLRSTSRQRLHTTKPSLPKRHATSPN